MIVPTGTRSRGPGRAAGSRATCGQLDDLAALVLAVGLRRLDVALALARVLARARCCPPPAQLPWPLHSLMPTHFTLSPPAFSSARALTAPERNSAAAAPAIRMPLFARVMDLSFSPGGGSTLSGRRLRRPAARGSFQSGPARLHHRGYGVEGGLRGSPMPGWLAPLLLAGAIVAAYSNGFDVPFVLRRLAHHRAEPGHPHAAPHAGLLRRSRHHDGPAREQGPASAAPGHDGAQLPASRAPRPGATTS